MYKAPRVHSSLLTLFATLLYNLSIDGKSETDKKHQKQKNKTFEKTCKVGISGTLIAFHLNFWLSCTLAKRKKNNEFYNIQLAL